MKSLPVKILAISGNIKYNHKILHPQFSHFFTFSVCVKSFLANPGNIKYNYKILRAPTPTPTRAPTVLTFLHIFCLRQIILTPNNKKRRSKNSILKEIWFYMYLPLLWPWYCLSLRKFFPPFTQFSFLEEPSTISKECDDCSLNYLKNQGYCVEYLWIQNILPASILWKVKCCIKPGWYLVCHQICRNFWWKFLFKSRDASGLSI